MIDTSRQGTAPNGTPSLQHDEAATRRKEATMALLLSTLATLPTRRAPSEAAPRSSAPRQPSLATRFFADLIAAADAGAGSTDPMVLHQLIKLWCYGDAAGEGANAPVTADAATPAATLESQVCTLAKAGGLPRRIQVLSARENRAAGFRFERTIEVLPAE